LIASPRAIYKAIESVTIVTEFDAALDVRLDLIDPLTDTVITSNIVMTDLTQAPGIYTHTFTAADLDTLLTPDLTDRLLLWRAYVIPSSLNIVEEYGLFYRGGFVDEWEKTRAFETAFASVDIPSRNVKAGMIDRIDWPLPHAKALRMEFSYRAFSGDVASVTTTIVDI